jgi:peptidoglycan biosynthesis protein MviN/MurJ (putative lipid II flippase)
MRRQIAIVSFFTIASQVAAFLKVWFTARIFGISPEMDGYNLSIILPTLISGVIAGVLQTGLFPIRAKLHLSTDENNVAQFERSILAGMAAIGIALTIALIVFSSTLTKMTAGTATEAVQTALSFALPFSATLITLNLIGDSCGYLLAMRNRFAIAAAAPIANGILGASLLFAWPEGGLLNLVGGTVLGLALQVSICLWGLRGTGFSLMGTLPQWSEIKKQWTEMLTLGGWILPGVIVSNLVVSLPPLWAAKYGEGVVSAFGYAYRLHSAALQTLVMASSTIILARFATLVAQGDEKSVRTILKRSTTAALIMGVLASLFVWWLGARSLEWLFGGRFNAYAANQVSNHWLILTLGLPFAMLGNVFAKLFQAQKRPIIMSALAFTALPALYVSHSILSPIIKELSIASSLTISSIASLTVGFALRNQRSSANAH